MADRRDAFEQALAPEPGVPSSSCLEGTASAETIPDLAPWPGEIVVRKCGYDAFAGTFSTARCGRET